MKQNKSNNLRAIEWPTVALLLGVYSAFGAATFWHEALTGWQLFGLGGLLVCLHGSLQHEAVHGHPTRRRWLNALLVFPSLWLWMPFGIYRDSHLTHHRNDRLTDPLEDPESYYVTPERWAAMGPLARGLLTVHNSLAGRLLLGPSVCLYRLLRSELARLLAGDFGNVRAWLSHGLSVGLVLAWVIVVCDLPLATYVLCFAYPGLSLTLLRSFLEHQARAEVDQRTVLVEAGPFFSLLFLNNNLHAVHHAAPGLAWYKIPARYRQTRDALLAANGGYRMRGYAEVFARYLLWAKESPVHPLMPAAKTTFAEGGHGAAPVGQGAALSPQRLP